MSKYIKLLVNNKCNHIIVDKTFGQNKLYLKQPNINELHYRQEWMQDYKTMKYNAGYDLDLNGYGKTTGIIIKTNEEMLTWYNSWINKGLNKYFAYIYIDNTKEPIGEVYYYLDNDKYNIGILIQDKYRGKGFDARNLYYFLNFYKTFPNILNAVSSKSNVLLSWTHYRTLLQVLDKEAREWYEKEALGQTWSVRTLQRNISSQYYYRLLKSQVKEPVIEEMKKVNENQYLMNKLEFVKNPVIAEFLGYSLDDSFTETELESSIINNLQKFLMELRKRICICCKTTTYSY